MSNNSKKWYVSSLFVFFLGMRLTDARGPLQTLTLVHPSSSSPRRVTGKRRVQAWTWTQQVDYGQLSTLFGIHHHPRAFHPSSILPSHLTLGSVKQNTAELKMDQQLASRSEKNNSNSLFPNYFCYWRALVLFFFFVVMHRSSFLASSPPRVLRYFYEHIHPIYIYIIRFANHSFSLFPCGKLSRWGYPLPLACQ